MNSAQRTMQARQASHPRSLSRRRVLQLGAGIAGLSLADLFRRRKLAAATSPARVKSTIIVMLSGGPSHIDTYDLKPAAPAEFRGEFRPIPTNVPGFDICELLPRQAAIADKLALVRSLKMAFNDHQNQTEMITGFPPRIVGGQPTSSGRPAFGSIVSRLGRRPENPLPSYVATSGDDENHRGQEVAEYVGKQHNPFVPMGEGLEDLALPAGLTRGRLYDRQALLRASDKLRESLDARGDMSALDEFQTQALEMIASPAVRDAFDISREPAQAIEKYTDPLAEKTAETTSGGYEWGPARFIQARRLAEAGVPVITLFLNAWDHHGRVSGERLGVFEKLRGILPAYDRYVHALVEDLHERGLQDDVTVLVWGEFGRSPRIDQKNVGRDHWPNANFALFAGGGIRPGQVIGATDARGEEIVSSQYTPQHVLATLYRLMGIDPGQTLLDHNGRPMYVLEERDPIAPLLA